MQPFIQLDMQLGESPRWNPKEQLWYWVDILGGCLYRADNNGQNLETQSLDFLPACFFFTENNQIIVTSNNGIFQLTEFGAEPKQLKSAHDFGLKHRFNDGVTTPDGHFIAGTISNGQCADGCSYLGRIEPNGELTTQKIAGGYQIINGQAFSPDGETYYVADSPSSQVWQYKYDKQSSTLRDGRLFYQFEIGVEFPDGAAVDSQGNYWVALYGSGKIAVISPAGERLKDIECPVSQPTMMAFGGKNNQELLITSARQHLDKSTLVNEPFAGSLFKINAETEGLTNGFIKAV
ncbi:SMP-30/gluconolactonase/LRE family protein [Reinekea thalattae]|uniref:SMP-30/gluconolactonase/LRE family protein n=1 Tax=Reinekea thalattae TaxID=2593301 RepID=A0A5C8Z403_9GAMM|nr:SMP-30/gluconolactonase/LRE family protein [Reinekea thalattae]TXR51953.1 SMP-30/gluconolactonase/LRE family protein [Reinekea thalattae]